MNDNNISQLHKPEPTDLLQQVLKQGAQQLLAQAIETEVQQLLADHKGLLTEDGRLAWCAMTTFLSEQYKQA